MSCQSRSSAGNAFSLLTYRNLCCNDDEQVVFEQGLGKDIGEALNLEQAVKKGSKEKEDKI